MKELANMLPAYMQPAKMQSANTMPANTMPANMMPANMMPANMDGMACMISPSPLPAMPVPAMAYIPFQQFNKNTIYVPEKGLENGTIFPELDKPFHGGGKR